MRAYLRMRMIYAFFAAFFMIAFCPVPALAQHDALTEDGMIDYSKVPDFTMIEARDVSEQCTRNHMKNLYYDCECLSLRFLEERLRQGLAIPRTSIEYDLRNDCRDATEAAGYEYNECLNDYVFMKAGTDPEEMCECYANTYIKLVEFYNPPMKSLKLSPIKVQAKLNCSDPAMAAKIYGRVIN